MPTEKVEARKTKGVTANGTGPDEEREQGGATLEGAGRKDWQPETLTLRPHLRLSLRGNVERQAQSEPDWLNKPEPVSETDRYAGEQPSRQEVRAGELGSQYAGLSVTGKTSNGFDY